MNPLRFITMVVLSLLLLCTSDLTAQCTFTMQPDSIEAKNTWTFGLPCGSSYAIFSGRCDSTNGGNVAVFQASAWTYFGTPGTIRSFLEYDLDTFANMNCTLDSAILYLYHDGGSSVHSSLSGTNETWINRVTQAWDENVMTWNNQPTIATSVVGQDYVSIPQSTSPTQTYILDITDMVTYWLANPADNFGLRFSLQTESFYRRVRFASDDTNTPNAQPKLEIYLTCPGVLTVSDTAVCLGDSAFLNVSGAPAQADYSWSPGTGLSDSTIQNPIASPMLTTTYTVSVFNGFCTKLDSVTITVNPLPVLDIGNDTAICNGNSVQLNSGIPQTGSYSWSPASSLNNPLISNPVATPSVTTTYTVTLIDPAGCMNMDSVTITLNPLPITSAEKDTLISKGQSVTLLASGGIGYLWNPAEGLSCTDCPNPVASPDQTITYYVWVTDSNGCISMDSLTITVIVSADLFIPNAFTPNSDMVNDVLFVYGNGITSLHLLIYDRWGKLVFESNNVEEGWDGTINGQRANGGVYAYYAEISFENGDAVIRQGDITLLR